LEWLVNLGFLSVNRRERMIFDGILLLLETVNRTVDYFEASVSAFAKGDSTSAEELVKKVFEGETKADSDHRELGIKIAEGAFFGGVREDMLNLLEKIDEIADSAKDAARFLSSDSRLVMEAGDTLGSPDMKSFLAALKASVVALTGLVRALDQGKKEALSNVHAVEEFEEEADSHKDLLLKTLFSSDKPMNPVAVIQLRDFIFVADDIADNAEDASDVILVLIAKGYG
jgi:predicted phosphate transport protein (TIGR00153 family)